ncbi:MAG: nucleoside-diphosphate kinase [Myxococcales bacterium]|nr:nucleoside-diphosphate kinase [Myxococcales bacterium]MDD9966038.1 nucleoside-diphosphate kinase [Myxococcales bacterium]
MAIERTLSIIKPDAVEKNKIGAITALIEQAGLEVKAMRMTHLSKAQAEGFYAEHKGRGFFDELVEFMTRSPVVLMCLEGEGAISKYRATMGATDPAKAEEGTIRKAFGSNIGENACHGSDSPESAAREVSYFFPEIR